MIAFLHWLFGRDPDQIESWSLQRAQKLERATLEASGLAGHHYDWHRKWIAQRKGPAHV
jgi:hypothetical protein